jgi:hypothetical protein
MMRPRPFVKVSAGPLAFVLAFGGTALARPPEYPLLPERLTTAKTVYVVNESGDVKAYDTFYRELKKWNRFEIVSTRVKADLVMTLITTQHGAVTSGTATANGGIATGFETTTPVAALQLRVIDAADSGLLWSDETDKWIGSSHAPSKLVANLRKRMPAR